MSNISSFDVFDTCLLRKCGSPYNLFPILSMNAFPQFVEDNIRQELVLRRIIAERDLYRNPKATVYDFYTYIEAKYSDLPYQKSPEELAFAEIELEKNMAIPSKQIRDNICKLRERGRKIVFISDMYLPQSVILEMLIESGLFKDGDALYVSCEYGCTKQSGKLFEFVKEKECADYSTWEHYGDNRIGDIEIPSKLGIKTHLVSHEYSPVQQKWIDSDYNQFHHLGETLAGIGRAVRSGVASSAHVDFAIDFVAPHYCTFVWKIMKDAVDRGVKKLFFCARDAKLMMMIALKYKTYFNDIDVRYLHISRDALKVDEQVLLEYFKQVGLASMDDRVAIVDTRSSGKTQNVINEILKSNGFLPIRGYYFEMVTIWADREFYNRPDDYFALYNSYIARMNHNVAFMLLFPQIFEDFCHITTESKTIRYIKTSEMVTPVFDINNESEDAERVECHINNREALSTLHQDLVLKYADYCLEMGLLTDCDCLLNDYILPSMADFFNNPDKCYMGALEDVMIYDKKRAKYSPLVEKLPLYKLLFGIKLNSVIWKKGTLCNSVPLWVYDMMTLIKKYMIKR